MTADKAKYRVTLEPKVWYVETEKVLDEYLQVLVKYGIPFKVDFPQV